MNISTMENPAQYVTLFFIASASLVKHVCCVRLLFKQRFIKILVLITDGNCAFTGNKTPINLKTKSLMLRYTNAGCLLRCITFSVGQLELNDGKMLVSV